jgi:glycosyltransferase involved in cell wall biosynthesis
MLIIILALISFNILALDLSVIGFVKKADGIGQHAICSLEALRNKISYKDINFISTNASDFKGVSGDIEALVKSGVSLEQSGFYSLGKVCFFTDLLWYYSYCSKIKNPKDNHIWIAYSVVEGSAVHPVWVERLNKYFDAVCVPDQYLEDVYNSSGVKIPIFVLPLAFNLSRFVDRIPERHNKFVFGFSSDFCERKNHIGLLNAFISAFKNNPDVCLRLHGRAGSQYDKLVARIKSTGTNNVELIKSYLSQEEYINFFSSLSCYVSPSKGEGFSISVREAMALGLPCVVTNNTAHRTICLSGLVYPVECPISKKAYYEAGNFVLGENFDFNQGDMVKALESAYQNYDIDYKSFNNRKKWVLNNYSLEVLQGTYASLFKPASIKFGSSNLIYKDSLVTNSLNLYKKYLKIIGCKEA